jgi:hypothetical protein
METLRGWWDAVVHGEGRPRLSDYAVMLFVVVVVVLVLLALFAPQTTKILSAISPPV